MDSYADKLNATKKLYPFDAMREYWQEPEDQDDCNALEKAFDKLISRLIELGPDAPAKKKVKCFEKAIDKTNEHANVIETNEREDIISLIDEITFACGLIPADYGGGAGLADEGRDW
jgi:hypothetical protein